MRQVITTTEAPSAIGPYSQAVKVDNQLFISGQIALDPISGDLVAGSVEAETRQILKNVGAILKAADMDYRDVVQSTVYLKRMGHFVAMNSIYGEFFQNDPPARATVEVSALPKNASIEMSFVAVKSG